MYRLAFVLLPEFSNLGLAAAVEPLFVANWLAQDALFAWTLVSVDGEPVKASNGMRIPVDGDLGLGEGCGTVFVLASFDALTAVRNPRLLRWLKRQARADVELAGLENGTLALAEAGLLGSQRVAVHWDNLIGFTERHPAVRPASQLFVHGSKRISSAGGAAILDLMLAWIGWQGYPDLATEVAQHLLIGAARRGDSEQRPPRSEVEANSDAGVALAVRIMRQTFDEPISCEELAVRVGLSLRQLERRFRAALDCSIVDQYRHIRMAAAHQLLQQTELSVLEAAVACGFSSPEYFCKLYRREFRCSPSSDRRQSTRAPVLRQRAPPPPGTGRGERNADAQERRLERGPKWALRGKR